MLDFDKFDETHSDDRDWVANVDVIPAEANE